MQCSDPGLRAFLSEPGPRAGISYLWHFYPARSEINNLWGNVSLVPLMSNANIWGGQPPPSKFFSIKFDKVRE